MQQNNSIEFRDVVKRFGSVTAVDGVSLDIRRGEFFSLLGPSGCGKSTLLRLVAGLEIPSSGLLRINGQEMTRIPSHQRPVHMVFQHYALFPHLTVGQNVAFGLRYKDIPRREYAGRVAEALALVRLPGLENRWPHQLSGGQRQRVALARALVLQPQVLLLDEPLGALDQKLRREMQVELKSLQRKLNITFVFVTHDQEEAMIMSDRLAVMNAGRVEQVGTSRDVFEYPASEFVAQFMGATNFFSGQVEVVDGTVMSVTTSGGFRTKLSCPSQVPGPGQRVRFVVRPEKLELRKHMPSSDEEAGMPVAVEDCLYQGISTVWTVRNIQGERFTVYQQNDHLAVDRDALAVGQQAYACWNWRHAVVLAADRACRPNPQPGTEPERETGQLAAAHRPKPKSIPV